MIMNTANIILQAENLLKSKGLTSTELRKRLLCEIILAGYVDIESVFTHFKPSIKGLTKNIIASELKVLEEKGLLTGQGEENHNRIYELYGRRGVYFICKECKSVESMDGASGRYHEFMAESTGKHINGLNLTLYGYCSKCRGN